MNAVLNFCQKQFGIKF